MGLCERLGWERRGAKKARPSSAASSTSTSTMGCCGSQEGPQQTGAATATATPPPAKAPPTRKGNGNTEVAPKPKAHQDPYSAPMSLFSPTESDNSGAAPPDDWESWNTQFAAQYDVNHLINEHSSTRMWKATYRQPLLHEKKVCEKKRRRSVACKVVNRNEVGNASWVAAAREVKFLQKLNHPNVVAYQDSYITPDSIITVMEICKGGELPHSLSEHKQIYTEGAVMRVMGNILSGITHVHDKEVCHRNVNPGHLLIKSKLRPSEVSLFEKVKQALHEVPEKEKEKVEEFPAPAFASIATCTKEQRASVVSSLSSLREHDIVDALRGADVVSHISSSIAIAGFDMATQLRQGETTDDVADISCNPYFTSPEILHLLRKKGPAEGDLPYDKYDQRCDVWSVGMVAYVLLTGQHPMSSDTGVETEEEVVGKTLATDVEYEQAIWASLSCSAREFTSSCLQRDYTKRPVASQLLKHRWFTLGSESPALCDEQDISHVPLKRPSSYRIKRPANGHMQGCCDIIWDEGTLQTSKDVLMTIESSLDPRDPRDTPLSARLMADLHEQHPSCVWLVYDDSGGCVKDYINELEEFQSHHVRLAIGSNGFLVIGIPGNKEKHTDSHCVKGAQVLGPDMEILECSLDQNLVDSIKNTALEVGGLGTVWVTDFLSVSAPDLKWVVILGTASGDSLITSESCPVLKIRYKKRLIHCFGFAKCYQLLPLANQRYPSM